jgi:hypothetical protein
MQTIRTTTITFAPVGFQPAEVPITRPDGKGWRFRNTQAVAVAGPEGGARVALVSLFERKVIPEPQVPTQEQIDAEAEEEGDAE